MKTLHSSFRPAGRGGSLRAVARRDFDRFELVCDSAGTVVFGWASCSVLYSRFDGGLTAGTGAAYAKRLGTLVAQAASVAFFCDLSRLTHYDLLARSSFARIVLAHRRKFKSLTILTWAQGMSAAMEGLVETLGGPIEVLTNHDEFDARLLKVAPFVRNKLDSIPYFAPGT